MAKAAPLAASANSALPENVTLHDVVFSFVVMGVGTGSGSNGGSSHCLPKGGWWDTLDTSDTSQYAV